MDLLWMTNLYPKGIESEIREKQKFNMYDAANELQWNLIDGFLKNPDCDSLRVCNLLPVDSWPGYYKDVNVKKHLFSVDGKNESVSVPFCNIKFLKHKSIEKSYIKHFIKMCRNENDLTVVLYSLSSAFLKTVKKVKKMKPGFKFVAIVADLPQFTSTDKNVLRRIYKKKNIETINGLMPFLDGYVLLTEHMAERLKITQPYVVMEGIAKENPYRKLGLPKFENKTVFYSGSLNKRYGLIHLLDAFSLIQGDEYRLLLCGMGDAEQDIIERAKNDPRIQFLGKLPHDEVLQYQCKATVLVNPRQNTEEYTKYSFPSKTLEYLASGTPVVAYKLDGIPDEYDSLLFYPKDESIEELKNTLINVIENSANENDNIQFLLKKNKIEQTKRIIDFIKRLV